MRIFAWALLFTLPVEARWVRLDSGPFILQTDAGEKAGREILARLDLARRVFGGISPRAHALPLPVRIFALGAEGRFRALRPGETTRGFYQSAAERDSIVLLAGATELSRIIFHEYVHLVLNHTSGPLPKWLEEGLAEFHSTAEVTGSGVRLGRPVDSHLRLLRVLGWMSADELAGVRKNAPHELSGATAGVFYAQSWALVHMLRLGERYRQNFPKFVALVERGEQTAAAFQLAFGLSMSEAVADLKPYLDRGSMPVVDLKIELADGAGEIRRLEQTELDGDLAYAELARECGQPKEAAKIYQKVARSAAANTPAGAAALGYLALAEDRRDEAATRFRQALELGSKEAGVTFELAMLEREAGADKARVRSLLEQAVERNPHYAEAHFLLGVADAAANRHDLAVRRIELAIEVFPRQSYFWHALALSQHALGRKDAAQAAARRAMDCATTSEQAEMAQAALRMTGQPAEAPAAKKAAVTTPESWKMKEGDGRAEGILERIDCEGQSARFHVRTAGKLVAFVVADPGAVLMKNLSSVTFQFRCGPQKPTPVVVEYQSRAGTLGLVTAIEFR